MSADLDAIQRKLEVHFAALAARRLDQGLPVFAFEHGLGAEDLLNVSTLLKVALKARYRLARHWLVWVVYATEQGYDYDGDEYWHRLKKCLRMKSNVASFVADVAASLGLDDWDLEQNPNGMNR